ncbi:MAG: hypothetical protein CMQ14_04360 [Gammaproteobacteria bacterium]|nr:hypothetical protein [Gammaproteobacteria bacterium]
MAEYGNKSQNFGALTVLLRVALKRIIPQSLYAQGAEPPALNLDADLEQILLLTLQQSVLSGGDPIFNPKIKPAIKPSLAQSLPDRCGPDTGSAGRSDCVAGGRCIATDTVSIRAHTFDGAKVLFCKEIS